jgi:hypothetical protein
MKISTFFTTLFIIFPAIILASEATSTTTLLRGNIKQDSGVEHRALSSECSREEDTLLKYPMRWSSDRTKAGCEKSCLLRVTNCKGWMFEEGKNGRGACFVSQSSKVVECDDDDDDKPDCDDFKTYVCD